MVTALTRIQNSDKTQILKSTKTALKLIHQIVYKRRAKNGSFRHNSVIILPGVGQPYPNRPLVFFARGP